MRVVITGAGTGLGRAAAIRFSHTSTSMLLIGRRPKPLSEVRQSIEKQNPKTRVVQKTVDVTNSNKLRHAISDFVDECGGVEVLVANAGINPQRSNATEATEAAWNSTLSVNLTGLHYSCQAVLPYMQKAQQGAIVTIGSIAGLAGMKNRAAYGPSKAAIINYTQALAIDYGEMGIRANCVCPGFVITDINRKWLDDLPAASRTILESRHVLGLGSPESVANAIYFLASKEAKWITGVALPVDGGWRAS